MQLQLSRMQTKRLSPVENFSKTINYQNKGMLARMKLGKYSWKFFLLYEHFIYMLNPTLPLPPRAKPTNSFHSPPLQRWRLKIQMSQLKVEDKFYNSLSFLPLSENILPRDQIELGSFHSPRQHVTRYRLQELQHKISRNFCQTVSARLVFLLQ